MGTFYHKNDFDFNEKKIFLYFLPDFRIKNFCERPFTEKFNGYFFRVSKKFSERRFWKLK